MNKIKILFNLGERKTASLRDLAVFGSFVMLSRTAAAVYFRINNLWLITALKHRRSCGIFWPIMRRSKDIPLKQWMNIIWICALFFAF